jgi:hypothetical protein
LVPVLPVTAPWPALLPVVVALEVESLEVGSPATDPVLGAPLTGEPVSPATFPPHPPNAQQPHKSTCSDRIVTQ